MSAKTPDPIDVHVGSQIRMRRLMLGMSQTALADRLGITFQQVQKYEKGTNRVGASRLQAISRVLEVPPEFFFAGGAFAAQPEAGTPAVDEALSKHLMTRDGAGLNRAFRQINDPVVRKRIVALVKALSEGEQGSDDVLDVAEVP